MTTDVSPQTDQSSPLDQGHAQVTLDSIGDAVLCTDYDGGVTFLNPVAEGLTGWSYAEAAGRPFADVCRIVDGLTRLSVPNPMALATTVALTANCVLMRRDGSETAIEDSAAPIRDRSGTITGAVMVFRDVSAARAAALTVSHRAQHDALTNLPNRTLLGERLGRAIANARERQTWFAVLFIDVDRFKEINDSLGHAIGDQLLQSIAQRLLHCVRSSDTVSRRGGDELVILLPDIATTDDAAVTVNTVTADLDSAPIVAAVIGLGRSLRHRVIAEGVETRTQLAFLRAHHCPEGQGLWFSPPLSADRFAHLLEGGLMARAAASGPETDG